MMRLLIHLKLKLGRKVLYMYMYSNAMHPSLECFPQGEVQETYLLLDSLSTAINDDLVLVNCV